MKFPLFDSLSFGRTLRLALLASLLASPSFLSIVRAQDANAPETPAQTPPTTAPPVQTPPAQSPPANAPVDANAPAAPANDAPSNDTSTNNAPAANAPATEAPAAPSVVVPADPDERLRLQTQYYNGGLAALKANRWDEAAQSFEKTLVVATEDAMARLVLGYVRLKQER